MHLLVMENNIHICWIQKIHESIVETSGNITIKICTRGFSKKFQGIVFVFVSSNWIQFYQHVYLQLWDG